MKNFHGMLKQKLLRYWHALEWTGYRDYILTERLIHLSTSWIRKYCYDFHLLIFSLFLIAVISF